MRAGATSELLAIIGCSKTPRVALLLCRGNSAKTFGLALIAPFCGKLVSRRLIK